MASSAIKTPAFLAKAGNVTNEDGSSIYSNGDWSLKNSTAVASVTIKDDGKVGIGVDSPNSRLHIRATSFGSTSGIIMDAGAQEHRWYLTDNFNSTFDVGSSAGYFTWRNSGGERMRLDASGNLLVGATSPSTLGITLRNTPSTGGNINLSNNSTSLGNEFFVINNLIAGSHTTSAIQFRRNSVAVGTITFNNNQTTYGGTSDYRLKEEVQPMSAALSKVAALKPCTYKWKSDGSDGEGFIAHELAEVCPLAVVGEKDAVKEDGSIDPQNIDPSKLVALLTAAIQEQQAMIEELKAKVSALEAK